MADKDHGHCHEKKPHGKQRKTKKDQKRKNHLKLIKSKKSHSEAASATQEYQIRNAA